jgi:hypothetical protein
MYESNLYIRAYSLSPLQGYRLIVERFPGPHGLESYAGGRVSPWQSHARQTGQRVEARRSVVPGPSSYVLGMWLTTAHRKNLVLRNSRGSQDPHRVVAPIKKKKRYSLNTVLIMQLILRRIYFRCEKFQSTFRRNISKQAAGQ